MTLIEITREVWDELTPLGRWTIGIPLILLVWVVCIVLLPMVVLAAFFPWGAIPDIFRRSKRIFWKDAAGRGEGTK